MHEAGYPKPVALGQHRGIGWGRKMEGGLGWGDICTPDSDSC